LPTQKVFKKHLTTQKQRAKVPKTKRGGSVGHNFRFRNQKEIERTFPWEKRNGKEALGTQKCYRAKRAHRSFCYAIKDIFWKLKEI